MRQECCESAREQRLALYKSHQQQRDLALILALAGVCMNISDQLWLWCTHAYLARMTSSVSCETNPRTCGTCTIGLQSVLKCDHILNLFFLIFLALLYLPFVLFVLSYLPFFFFFFLHYHVCPFFFLFSFFCYHICPPHPTPCYNVCAFFFLC